ncbi:hypothetical protein [Marinomonas mediterranea]|jgi:hypothetical protein|uniref:Nucleoside recognition domain-containing protein n=1 Tax=Marinomonas mediterranea (strain ATCC 700492 / JCM 21426 / NBRC 103028 / MMB-1) TaxID=717774 RepID=F2K3T2_MARM1|nr:hypothetical protein [Marinomonas mediterranea]ADZ90181.1 nucleoside recognition domain-containing protein [Marinomonas mediterranea MMB-1]WCN08242.1 hypothetical protein GV055_04575 [Marinomonas mediterranea]WCN12308.1 hypothetical protein GV054_04475 [Marinomonas mediterranea]WCN16380.1 hypothetical protein GV053_04580 [Marinomonas mediterranea MMB-1]
MRKQVGLLLNGLLLKGLWQEIFSVTWTLFKVMIPMIVIIKVIEELGGIILLSQWLSPVMSFVGLPSEMGLVWATTLVTNIYAGLLVFMSTDADLTVAQVSILGILLLIAHGLPIEAAIAKKAGVGLMMTLGIRLGGSLLMAWVVHHIYQAGNLLNYPAETAWQHTPSSHSSYADWAISQVEGLFMIFIIIAALITFLRLLKLLGIEKLMGIALKPILSLLGISREATNLTVIGITLGLSFGGGLLINEAKRGHISPRDIFVAIMLLNLLHSLIEDTLLILLIGANFTTIFWGRIVFSIAAISLLVFVINRLDEATCRKYFYKKISD